MDKKRLYVCEVVTLGVRHSIKANIYRTGDVGECFEICSSSSALRFKDYRQLSTAIESNIFQTKIIGQLNYIKRLVHLNF